ncbi:hypothetical protein KSS94_08910 [Pseudomonas fakonensis]|uniref:DUF3800 domain-containing protein n=1 Tax=Pseudomonas fakonensis TaxID=2842355 RepID=A0ABX8NBS5_9PSED|nr:hypothetical protein [Pseudomonas fakonensis]QXH53216.1 hypothetical protein KSS94_08910 [Pseudomonas fakonensis]
MFVYLDETEFGDGSFSGYGCLVSPTRIGRAVIDEALENLRDDPDRFNPRQKPMDDRTLQRSFFHAADDSKNAHSHLCRSICKHVVGDYNSHIFHTGAHSFSSKDELYDLASKLAVVGLFSRSAELTFIFERRGNLNVLALLSKWWPVLWFDLARNAYASPFIVKYYPKVSFEVLDKSEPGLQVVDFMLWAAQKARMDDRSNWFSRLPGWIRTKTTAVDGGWEGESIRMLKPTPNPRYDIEHCRFDAPKFGCVEILQQFIVNVQVVINKACFISDRARIEHFYSDVEYLCAQRVVPHDPGHIKKMAVCFIRLFDNIAVVSEDTPFEDKTFWLATRKCLALVLHDGIEAWVHTLRLADMRNMLIDQQPDCLSIGFGVDPISN